MKKVFYFLCCLVCCGIDRTIAQVSEGGKPLTMDAFVNSEIQQYTAMVSLPAPDIEALKYDDKMYPQPGQLRIGVLVPADIDIQNSGTLSLLSDGRKIWRLQIQVPGMQALGLYYDQFSLPQGVKYFLYNANHQQVVGAFTANENPDDGMWANEKIQGDLVNLEMDIDEDVDIAAIKMHINNVGVFYKATDYLLPYAASSSTMRTTAGPKFPFNGSSPCEVNAACSTSASIMVNQSNATVHIEYTKGAFIFGGTGVMVNNVIENCTPYVLTATHIEPTNSKADATYSAWVFYYHYEAPTCIYTGAKPGTSSMVGAYFRSRASYDSSSNKIKGDFLLLELKSHPPLSYNYYYSGWDNSDAVSNLFGTFISYHHPSGDIKKVSKGVMVSPLGNFNNGASNSHWDITFTQGGIEEGSSGSGLFNSSGLLMGILSGGNTNSSCTDTNIDGQRMTIRAEYSKLSYDWIYTVQTPSTPSSRLKDWLDPLSSNVTTLGGMTPCPVSVTKTAKKTENIRVYPNPTNGNVFIDLPPGLSNVHIDVYNALGMRLDDIYPTSSTPGTYSVNLSQYPAGVYLLRISAGDTKYVHTIILK